MSEAPRITDHDAALERALAYLSHRPRSRFELERHLRDRGYVDAAIGAALARCEALGYVDDREFAAAFARDRIRLRPRSPVLMEAELRKRGVSVEDARSGIADALVGEGVEERDLLRRAAEKGARRLRGRERETARRRLLGYLSRRGFRASEARVVVADLLGDG